jgi:hypothetical protein
LLDEERTVRYQGKLYETASAAAKAITVGWKSIDVWNFWRFYDTNTKKWIAIKHLIK